MIIKAIVLFENIFEVNITTYITNFSIIELEKLKRSFLFEIIKISI